MTIEQLRIFLAVAERENVTRAAEALGLTQSAASAALASLENRYGVRLFDRVGRGVRLSAAGAIFVDEARAALGRVEAAEGALQALAGLRRGALALYASQTIAAYWLPPRMARFAAAYPGIALRLAVGNTAQVARAVAEGEAELGFVEGRVDDDRLDAQPVGGDRLRLVAAPDHPLCGRTPGPADLAGAAWAMREPGSGTRSELEAALRAEGVDPARLDVRLELPSNEAVLAAAASAPLIAAVSELAAAPFEAAGGVRRLAFDFPDRTFARVELPGRRRSPAAEAFLAGI